MHQFNRIAAVAAYSLLAASALYASPVDQTQSFVVDQPTRVPGAVLQPGNYQISILDYLPDRSILQIKKSTGEVQTTFVGVPALKGAGLRKEGLSSWPKINGEQSALRGWWTPTEKHLIEFAYPKNDAVEIAKANHASVPAIDPESQGMASINSLKTEDMKVVGLWLLSTSAVAGDDGAPKIRAEHYRGPRARTASAQTTAPTAPADPGPAAGNARLPGTAGLSPLLGLIGLCCLFLAGLLTLTRGRKSII